MATDEKLTRPLLILILCVVLLSGLYLRLNNLSGWLDHKERYFFSGQQIPLMLTVDSYYYLEMARQLQEGTYVDFDKRRYTPQGYKQPETPPLLSVLLAGISRLTGVRLEWIALFLPACLGIFLAIPVYLLATSLTLKAGQGAGKLFSIAPGRDPARVAGLTAAFIALLSPMFLARSSIGWCDTDALNVAFPILLAWLALQITDAQQLQKRIFLLTAFAITSLLFLWWWDQSHVPVFAFILIPFGLAVLFTGLRSPARLLPLLILAVVLLLSIGFWKGFGLLNPLQYIDNVQGLTRYISSDAGSSPFRAAGEAVSEQSRASFIMLMRESSGGPVGFWLACCGLLALICMTRWWFLFLTPLVVVAVLSPSGQRFLIFTAPLFGLGAGTLAYLLFCLTKKIMWRIPLLVLLIVISCWGAVQLEGKYDKRVPRRLPGLFDAMQVIEKTTEKNAVIWASWGHGHPLLYYGQRSIIADGIFHNAELQYVLNFPFATESYRQAANWISFYVQNGSQGLHKANQIFAGNRNDWAKGMAVFQELLAGGVEKSRQLLEEKYQLSGEEAENILSWLFPGNPQPVYLFLDYLLPSQAWFTLGQWNLKTRSAPVNSFFLPLKGIGMSGNGIINGRSRMGKLQINPGTGQLQFARGTTRLSSLTIFKKNQKSTYTFNAETSFPLYAQMYLSRQLGLLAGRQETNTVLVKLYYQQTGERNFFNPKDVGSPYYAIWRVTGEQYRP